VCHRPRSITLPRDTKRRPSGQAVSFRGLRLGRDKPRWRQRASLSGLLRGIANGQCRFIVRRHTDQRQVLGLKS